VNIPRLLALALCAALPWVDAAGARPAVAARGLQGVVLKVSDGNSLSFAPAGQAAMEVRLRDIDAPELCQAWGVEARRALEDLALNKTATLRPSGRDRDGRTLGSLMVEELDIGRRMVEDGHAWSVRTRSGHGPLLKQERMAHSLGRGLHSQGGAILPSDYRRLNGPCVATAGPARPSR
jgi:endonuclease YncB( thermonuclease family)